MALLDEVPAIPTEDISWARLDAKDGENKTNNNITEVNPNDQKITISTVNYICSNGDINNNERSV